MPTRTEFKADLSLQLGLSVPSLAAQCQNHGLTLSNAELWEQRHQAWLLLRVGGFMTDNEAKKIGVRIVDAIALEVGFDSAVAAAIDVLVGSFQERKPEEGAASEESEAEPAQPQDADVLNWGWHETKNLDPTLVFEEPDRITEYLDGGSNE